MATMTKHKEPEVYPAVEDALGSTVTARGAATTSRLNTEQIWDAIGEGSFAVISYVTPSGEPRSSGVMYKAVGQRLYVVVAPDSWKAKHIAVTGNVAMTVPVRRGGVLSLIFPIPPATISFHGTATVHQGDSVKVGSVVKELENLLPAERRTSASVIEITPEGSFVAYGIRVSLNDMRDPNKARARLPVQASDAMSEAEAHDA